MYYELYVDVLFLVNFMMDYVLLLIVRKMLKCSATHGNICLGALVGAGLTCIVTILPIPYAVVKLVLFHLLVNTSMILSGLKIKSIRALVKAYVMLYIGSFLLGGILEAFRPYVKIGSLFFALSIGGYYIVLGCWKMIAYIQRWNRYHCEVILYLNQKNHRVKGFIDTGNGLLDPTSGKPVSILVRESAKTLLEEGNVKNMRYIPYGSIGGQRGVLLIVQIDRMCVRQDTEYWIEHPLIGISEEKTFAGGEYELILNPNLF